VVANGLAPQAAVEESDVIRPSIGKRCATSQDLLLRNAGFGTTGRAKVRHGDYAAK